MFQPKKTIPKLIVGALALSGCGDPGGDAQSEFRNCLSELGPSAAELCRQMGSRNDSGNDGGNARPDGDGFYGDGYDGEYAYGDNGYGDDYGSYGYGYGGYGDGGGVVLPDNDPNPTNDPFLPGGDSYYGG